MTDELEDPTSRRRALRLAALGDIGIKGPDGCQQLGELRDISATGCRVASPEPLALGETYRVAFQVDHNAPLLLQATVTWCGSDTRRDEPAGPGETSICGLNFDAPPCEVHERLSAVLEEKGQIIASATAQMRERWGITEEDVTVLTELLFARDLAAGEHVEDGSLDGCLIILRRGRLVYEEVGSVTHMPFKKEVLVPNICGFPPLGKKLPEVRVSTNIRSSIVGLQPKAFRRLVAQHPQTAFRLLDGWLPEIAEAYKRRLVAQPV